MGGSLEKMDLLLEQCVVWRGKGWEVASLDLYVGIVVGQDEWEGSPPPSTIQAGKAWH